MKKYIYKLILVLISLLTSFILIELFTQFYFDPKSGTNISLKGIEERAKKRNLSISSYARQEGWSRFSATKNAKEIEFNNNSTISRLIIGDSVTGGHGLIKEKSYAEIIANDKKINTHIWHIAGGGIDQLFLKVITEAQFLDYNKINIAFIAHDVLRSGTRFIYSSTKIKFYFGNDDQVSIILAEDLGDFHNNYLKAKNNYYLSFWYLKKYYLSKEHFFPNFFFDYYKKLFEHITAELENIAKKNNIEINLINLPNSYNFKGDKTINEAFINVLTRKYSKLKLYDLNNCAKQKSTSLGLDFNKEFNFHPGPVGHKIIAECFKDEVKSF
jgi:hypothetical protein